MMRNSSRFHSSNALDSEELLVSLITEYLAMDGYRVRHEVSNMGQSIDLVATKNRWITAIEAKRSHWRRALEQCKAHTLVADYIAVALPQQVAAEELNLYLEAEGWGLLLYESNTNRCYWEIQPKRNKRVWRPQRQQFAKDLKKVEYAS